MKILVISDIHGDSSSAKKIVELANSFEQIWCLGDVLYHGPRNDLPANYAPKEVIKLLNPLAHKITAVRGNCEAEVDQMVLDFACMADYNITYLSNRKVFMSHGHLYSPSNLPKDIQENDIFLSGHTHVPTAHQVNGIWLLNPGSISLPKENHPRTYGVIDENCFTIYTLDDKEYMKATF